MNLVLHVWAHGNLYLRSLSKSAMAMSLALARDMEVETFTSFLLLCHRDDGNKSPHEGATIPKPPGMLNHCMEANPIQEHCLTSNRFVSSEK